MDKLTPAVIVALIAGGIAGYFIHGAVTSTETPNSPNQQALSETQSPSTSSQPGSEEAKIQDALSAAPESLREDATVMDFPEAEGGSLIELQQGTNGWTCLPDYPASPGKDPMCLDKSGMEWLQAYVAQKTPSLTQIGLAYMLEGGSDASNTDPFATTPTEGEDWITTPSHVMVFPVGRLDPTLYGTDPKKGGAWIMWAGTPYEHLMIPAE